MAESVCLSIGVVNQLLNVSIQVKPTPLKRLAVMVHFGSITVDDYPCVVADQLLERCSFSIEKDTKDRYATGHSAGSAGDTALRYSTSVRGANRPRGYIHWTYHV